ncbi:MAG TPA: type II toxin-antitoxin system RelB/DinJ family antitoxin [Opitutaceae bacterium]|nr:type II toxin-antitoxin system RelB/DinJ family antitoxin [Opitutaceae bacterium]
MASVQLRVRIDRKLKKKSDVVLKNLGLDAASFVSMALMQLVNRRALPFAVVESDADYFATEYGLSAIQRTRAATVLTNETKRARRSGKLRSVARPSDLAS